MPDGRSFLVSRSRTVEALDFPIRSKRYRGWISRNTAAGTTPQM